MRQEFTREANYQDGDDCAKKFLCELSEKYSTNLGPTEWDEALLFNAYNQPVLDYSSDSLLFNIAVKARNLWVPDNVFTKLRPIIAMRFRFTIWKASHRVFQVGIEGRRTCSDVYPKCMFKFEELRRILQRQGQISSYI